MIKSFRIEQAIELTYMGTAYDLHNRYDFGHLTVSSGRGLSLLFCPDAEYGRGLPMLRMDAIDVDFLELSDGLGTRELTDVDELGYKHPHDADLDWLMKEEQATPQDHCVVRFSAEDYVRFHAREVLLVVGGELASTSGSGRRG